MDFPYGANIFQPKFFSFLKKAGALRQPFSCFFL